MWYCSIVSLAFSRRSRCASEEAVEFFRDVFFAFAAEYFAASAPAFALGQFAAVFFEEEEVVLEDAADGRVSARFSLFCGGAFAACEGVPDFLFDNVRWVRGEYACFRHAGAHFSACAKSWEEAAVDLGGFVVAEFLGDVACYAPVGVLVDGCWDEGGDVFAC